MTELTDSLTREGWYLSDEGIAELKGSAENASHSDIIRIALDNDLRSTGRKFLPSDVNSGRTEKLDGPCVLQVQKVRNISAPKDHEESQGAPRMLRLQMTDGHTTCVGLEYKHLSKISLNTPPGTKVKLLGTVQVKNGLLMLDDSKISVLGGEVYHMVEKWELQRTLAKHSRSHIGAEGGPPPFVQFGQISPLWLFNLAAHHFTFLGLPTQQKDGEPALDQRNPQGRMKWTAETSTRGKPCRLSMCSKALRRTLSLKSSGQQQSLRWPRPKRVPAHLEVEEMQAVIYPPLLPSPGAETLTNRGDETTGLKYPKADRMKITESWWMNMR